MLFYSDWDLGGDNKNLWPYRKTINFGCDEAKAQRFMEQTKCSRPILIEGADFAELREREQKVRKDIEV